MTETYNGYWSPVRGDTKETVPDIYHRYPGTPEKVNMSGADRAEAEAKEPRIEDLGLAEVFPKGSLNSS